MQVICKLIVIITNIFHSQIGRYPCGHNICLTCSIAHKLVAMKAELAGAGTNCYTCAICSASCSPDDPRVCQALEDLSFIQI